MNEIGGDPGAPMTAHGLTGLLDKGDQLIAKAGAKIHILGRLLSHLALSTRGILLALIGLLLLLILPPLVSWALRRFKHQAPNFRREWIPQSYGLVILLWAGAMLTLSAKFWPAHRHEAKIWLLTLGGFGTLGFLDDLRGDRTIKGLRGHFKAAFVEHKITTGFIKAVGGALLALVIGHLLRPDRLQAALLDALLIALSANFLNLLDLRPGRAGAVFLVASALLLWATLRKGADGIPPLFFVFLPALPVYERDARASVMLGDTGSNLLGACLGLGIATAPVPTFAKGFALVLLVAFHVLTERLSLTTLIEKTPVLRTLDRLTGAR